MKYKKIRAESISKCTMEMRKNYGDDAIVLGTRMLKEGGLLGTGFMSHDVYEIEFMVMEKNQPPGSVQESLRGLKDRDIAGSTQKTLNILEENKLNRGNLPNHDLLKENPQEREAIHRILNDLDPIEDEPIETTKWTEVAATPVQGSPAESGPASSAPDQTIYKNLPVVFSAELPKSLDLDERSARHFLQIQRNLMSAHLSKEFADAFLGRIDHNLSRSQKQEYHKVLSFSQEKLANMIQSVSDIAPPPGQCRGVLLMGPTGSGKTTTLAKLAAKYYSSRDVSIYSLDHYRLAATEQLKSYADVMQLPFHAPRDTVEFAELIRRDGAELILIDSSGIGFRDVARMERLLEFIEAVKEEIRLEKHLCLAANLTRDILEKNMLAYDTIGFDKIILTKIDEAEFIGAFVELADKFNRPFSFLCDGQEVPNNIQEADSRQIANMVLKKDMSLSAVTT